MSFDDMENSVQVDGAMEGRTDTTIQATSNIGFDDFENMEKARDEFKEKYTKKDDQKSKGTEPAKAAKSDSGKDEESDGESEEEAKEEVKKVYKMLKGKLGEDEAEIPLEAVIPWKVNGKVEEFKLEDILNEYSGKVDLKRKYTDFDKEKKGFTKEREQIAGLVNKFNELAKGGDPLAPLTFLIDTGKGDAYSYIERMRNHFYSEFEEMSQLSDAERKAYQLQKKLDFIENHRNSQAELQKEETLKQEQTAKVGKLLTDNGIDQDDFEQVTDYLQTHTKQDWEPEKVVEYITKWVPAAKVEQEVVQKLGGAEKLGPLKEQVFGIAFDNPEFSSDDIVEILQGHLKESKKKDTSEVLIEKMDGAKITKKKVTTQNKIESFSDFDD